ncbi:MAG: hypothetical protein K2M98_06540, partial [Muribaculum sp.]|nr:hypothetical protein [Muribaculum sp.]
TDEIFAHIKEQQQIAGSDSGALPPAIPENESPEDVEAEEVVDSDSTDDQDIDDKETPQS